ncbi:hypothetical protein K8R03_02955 [Candidatus Kaiserbacteria bacterium]|nr:hypothetical protein [Candidatus Kaiserbacteria bacterium]
MPKPLLEKLCDARTAPIRKKCPITLKAAKGDILYDVPDTYIRNVIWLMSRQYSLAGRVIVSRRRSDRNKCFPASQKAHSVEVMVFDYLRSIRGDDDGARYTLHSGWKYSVYRVR